MTPSLGQGALALQELVPTETASPLPVASAEEQRQVRSAMREILGEKLVPR